MSAEREFARIENILNEIGMSTVLERFKKEKIDEKIAVSLSDNELIRLGLTTIGDRVRFRDLCRKEINILDGACTSASNQASTSRSSQVQRERALLFNVRTSSRAATTTRKKESRKRTWMGNFMCLADRQAARVPSADEKLILQKAGLGIKKISFAADDDEKAVVEKIISNEKIGDTGETVGFPKLKDCGGFELMHCIANCRNLNILDCSWSVKSLRSNIGAQTRIYIRPIQLSLSTKPVVEEELSEIEEMCKMCGKNVLVRNLRTHTMCCVEAFLESSGSDEETTSNENGSSELQCVIPTVNSEVIDVFPNVQVDNDVAIAPVPGSTDVEPSVDELVEAVSKHCLENAILEPVEILRYFQKQFVIGRELEVTDPNQVCDGLTNYILVDRANILKTSLDEIKDISNLRPTLQVEFYGECAEDYGGPRKEFFRLVLGAIQDKYFDKGLRDHLCEDYKPVGTIMGLSIIQNGKIPRFLSEEVITEVFGSTNPTQCIANLRDGLAKVGIFQLFKQLPILKQIFHQTPEALTVKQVVHIYRPLFSEEGSNNLPLEKSVYSAFLKYIREVASGRRGSLSLAYILQFGTGTDEEPLLGFVLHPSLKFVEVSTTFLPTANTCINSINLPRPTRNVQLPELPKLFNLYDYAFSNTYFGHM